MPPLFEHFTLNAETGAAFVNIINYIIFLAICLVNITNMTYFITLFVQVV